MERNWNRIGNRWSSSVTTRCIGSRKLNIGTRSRKDKPVRVILFGVLICCDISSRKIFRIHTPTPLNKKTLPSQKALEVSYVMRPYAEKRVWFLIFVFLFVYKCCWHSWIQEFLNSWIHEFMDSCHELLNSWIHESMNSCPISVQGYAFLFSELPRQAPCFLTAAVSYSVDWVYWGVLGL